MNTERLKVLHSDLLARARIEEATTAGYEQSALLVEGMIAESTAQAIASFEQAFRQAGVVDGPE